MTVMTESQAYKRYVELANRIKQEKDEMAQIESEFMRGKLKENVYIPDLQMKIAYSAPQDKKDVKAPMLYDFMKERKLTHIFVENCSVTLKGLETALKNIPDVNPDIFLTVIPKYKSESFSVKAMTKTELKEHS